MGTKTPRKAGERNAFDTPEDIYTFIVKSVDISSVGNIAELDSNKELARILGDAAFDVGETLPKMGDGGFQIVSHDITISGTTMTITFLARHPGSNTRQSL
jgi:hypothetical protein